MTIPDVADLVTIAARVLEIDTGEVLDLIDLPAAEAALSGSPAAAAIRPRWRLRC